MCGQSEYIRQVARKILLSLVWTVFICLFASFHVQAGTLTLSPTSGVAGSEVFVTGSAFDLSTVVTFTWDGAPLTTIPSIVTTTGAGALPTNVSFVVPSSNIGAHTIRASTSSQNFANVTFTINSPALAVASPAIPAAGLPPGVIVVVTGSNFEANQPVNLYFDDVIVGTTTSTMSGTFQGSFAIPDVNNTGAHVIKASNSSYAIGNLTMTVAAPAITVNPSSGLPGSTITITGTNFKANSAVSFLINSDTFTPVAAVTTNGAGSFVGTFVIPNLTQSAVPIKAYSYGNLYAIATYTVSTPALTINPATAANGTLVNFTGTNFKTNSNISIILNGTAISTTPATITSDANGAFGGTFYVPDLGPGAVTFRAESYDGLFAAGTLTISSPTLALNPASSSTAPYYAGQKVVVSGSNFKASSAVTITINGSNIDVEGSSNSTITANHQGAFFATIRIPALTAGYSIIRAYNNSVLGTSASVYVGGSTLAVQPASGTAGLPVTLVGSGFEADSNITLFLNGKELSIDPKPRTNSVGGFNYKYTIPNNLPGGAQVIKAETSTANQASTTYTVTASSASISPSSGVPGTRIMITGANFKPDTQVTFLWNGKSLAITEGTITTTSLGAFVANAIVPAQTVPGANQVEISTDSITTSIVAFTISAPTITLSTSSGTPGSKITISGTNYEANKYLSIYWDDDILPTEPSSVLTTAYGGFTAVIRIPQAISGTHYIRVSAGNELNMASSSITVNAPGLVLGASTGRAGGKGTISGSGFAPNTGVELWMDGKTKMKTTKPAKTDGVGGFVAEFFIPSGTSPGVHEIVIKTGNTILQTVNYTVNMGDITLSRSEGGPGLMTMVNGKDFNRDANISVFWDGKKITLPEHVKTDAIGSFNLLFPIPKSSPGKHTLRISTDKIYSAEANFTILSPEIVIKPDNGYMGDRISIVGKNFTAAEKIKVRINARGVSTNPGSIESDNAGNFNASIALPFVFWTANTVFAYTDKGDLAATSVRILDTPISMSVKIVIFTLLFAFVFYLFWKVNKNRIAIILAMDKFFTSAYLGAKVKMSRFFGKKNSTPLAR